MANEILINQLVKLTIDGESETLIQQQVSLDCASSKRVDKVLSIGTSEEDIGLDDVTSPGEFFIANLDTTNSVNVGPKSAGAMVLMCTLPPRAAGESPLFAGPFPLGSGVVMRAIAAVAACNVRVICLSQ